jgi:hypothetical protein
VFEPGSRVAVRDAEWEVVSEEENFLGNLTMRCVCRWPEWLAGMEALFLEDVEDSQPTPTKAFASGVYGIWPIDPSEYGGGWRGRVRAAEDARQVNVDWDRYDYDCVFGIFTEKKQPKEKERGKGGKEDHARGVA